MRMNRLEEVLKSKGIVHFSQFGVLLIMEGCAFSVDQGPNNPSAEGN